MLLFRGVGGRWWTCAEGIVRSKTETMQGSMALA